MVNSPPVSVGWGIKKALFSVFLVVNILKFDINCTFFLGLFSTYQAKNQKQDLGAFAPNPTHLRGRRGMWQNLSTFPWAECWVDSKASRVKCTTASPLTLSISLGVAKRSEADGAGNLSRLAKQPRSGLAFTGWRRPNALWLGCRVAVGVACTPATWRTRVGQRPRFDKLP